MAMADPTVLDLTNEHLQNLEGVVISDSLTYVDLTANRLKEIDPRVLALKHLQALNLRQNLLGEVSSWNDCACKATLEDLEFRDNQIKEIPELSGFTQLTRLELSYNEIRSTTPLQDLGALQLQELYVAANKVTDISGLDSFSQLTQLELGSNRIKTIEHLDHMTGLQQLWLGRNRISQVQGLQALTNLRKISLQSNRLESMLGLEACTSLEELYLSHNGIWRIEGTDTLANLRVLDVSNNRISKVENLEALSLLEDLWLNDNQIEDLAQVEQALQPVKASLAVIYLENNPAAKDAQYKERMRALLPKLEQLDATPL